jgi:4-hydroxybutyrate CoA-transferase
MSKKTPRYVSDWQRYYQEHLVSAEEAVKAVQSGDIVAIPIFPPRSLLQPLFARKEELRNVTLRLLAPATDPGWFQPGSEESFNIEFELYIGDFARFVMDERRGTYLPDLFSLMFKGYDERPGETPEADVVLVSVSPPNSQGYVHFGVHNWMKRAYVRRVRTAIAEVDPTLIPVHGDVWAHVSEFDYFVEYTPPPFGQPEFEALIAGLPEDRKEAWRALAQEAGVQALAPLAGVLTAISPDDARRFLGLTPPSEEVKTIAGYLSTLIRDGDCIQIGTGEPSRLMPNLGVFDNRVDLGLHTELGSPGLGRLVKEGVINGKRKTINRGKAVATAWTGCDLNDFAIIADNPAFELYDPDYVLNLRTLAQIENFVAINNAVSIDFFGQINSESRFGPNMINGTGGQPEMHIGGIISKGGRSITLLPSTALGGSVSRIVPVMDAGSIVTIPRYFADIVITEYGIARLWGKNHRQRAEELISIAHPDFRAELRKELHRLMYP